MEIDKKSSIYVSIIIPTKNAGDAFDSTIKTIFNCAKKNNFEVIAVDSGSTDNTKAIISKYPVKLIEIPPDSFTHGGARNLAAQNATGDFLVFLTQDAVPEDDHWLLNLLKNFDDNNVAGVYGRQIPGDKSSLLERFFLAQLYPDFKIVRNSIDPNNCLLTDIFFSNVNSMIRKKDWEETRFDEKLIMSEDQDWAKRTLLKGKKIIYEPTAVVFHNHYYNISSIVGRNFDSGMSLSGIVRAPFKRVFFYEIGYLKEGLAFFTKMKAYLYLLIFPFYEAARLFGFIMGYYNRFLPVALKKSISQNKAYWRKNTC